MILVHVLDIKVKEPTLESLTKKKKEYMPPRFMSVAEAAIQILQIIEKHQNTGNVFFYKRLSRQPFFLISSY